jgi:hypothetical protein
VSAIKGILIALDQLLNVLLFFLPGGTWPDETLSARSWRCRDLRPFTKLQPAIDRLFFWQPEHCRQSYESELQRLQSPPAERIQSRPQGAP